MQKTHNPANMLNGLPLTIKMELKKIFFSLSNIEKLSRQVSLFHDIILLCPFDCFVEVRK